MTLNVTNDKYKYERRSIQNFRSLGGLEVSNSLTGIGTEGHFVCCLELLRN